MLVHIPQPESAIWNAPTDNGVGMGDEDWMLVLSIITFPILCLFLCLLANELPAFDWLPDWMTEWLPDDKHRYMYREMAKL